MIEEQDNLWKGRRKILLISSSVLISVVGILIFEDYLESRRMGRSFYFSESFLFKTIWFLFAPILLVLYKQLKKHRIINRFATALFIIIPIIAHYLILPIVFLFFSVLFYGGRYDLYKILSYTLANDMAILIVVYSSFVLGYKYFSSRAAIKNISSEEPKKPAVIVINNGKENKIVKACEIIQIIASTPYVTVHTPDKKYLHTSTLKSIHEVLDKKEFLRIHKSAIVNIHQVVSFKSRLNGDYDLQLKNGEQVRLSRTYASKFKNALANRVAE